MGGRRRPSVMTILSSWNFRSDGFSLYGLLDISSQEGEAPSNGGKGEWVSGLLSLDWSEALDRPVSSDSNDRWMV
ncbi:hypothetical protein FXO38_29822, partial [Capsicum annuum]